MQNIYVETCYEMDCNFINVNCKITEYIAANAQIALSIHLFIIECTHLCLLLQINLYIL